MSQPITGTMLTADQAVELAQRLRAAGVQRFVLTPERFSAVLSPPPPPPLRELSEQIAELKPAEREALLDQERKKY